MIKSLYIKDFALIDELEVEFGPGLNILTGQTGAGKSIIIGALNMILGERADTEMVREGANRAVAEAHIELGDHEPIASILQENEVEPLAGELILRREIRPSGSRAFINDTPVKIGVLKSVGDFLVDLHGQHDHQFLLRDENHQSVIDEHSSIRPLMKQYREAYELMALLQRSLRDLRKKERELKEKTELYRFQVQELSDAQLDPVEEDSLEAEMNLLDNAEVLDQKAAAITALGSGDEVNLLDLLGTLRVQMQDLAEIEPEFGTWLEEVNTARISLQEAIQFTERYRNTIEFNPARLETLRRRQAELNRLQKKYARTIPELIEYLKEIQKELNMAENFDMEIEKLEEEIRRHSDVLRERAVALHEQRIRTGELLSRQIEEKLQDLGITHPRFEVQVEWIRSADGWISVEGEPVECRPEGGDEVTFLISTNRGESPRPLARIASGGEISRVMLALKSIMAGEQQLPVMIFDEIDTGISGHISEKVGKAMRSLAGQCQIIAITHQPQIAGQAHRHYRVEKVESGPDERTVTRITLLQDEEHVREVASLMSGQEVTEAAINSARELIRRSLAGQEST